MVAIPIATPFQKLEQLTGIAAILGSFLVEGLKLLEVFLECVRGKRIRFLELLAFSEDGGGDSVDGGGGGGGYYGGGSGRTMAGAGGSSYCNPIYCSSVKYSIATTYSNGSIQITYNSTSLTSAAPTAYPTTVFCLQTSNFVFIFLRHSAVY